MRRSCLEVGGVKWEVGSGKWEVEETQLKGAKMSGIE
jgi:hypothetical protein